MDIKLGKPRKPPLENISQFKDRPCLINGADGKVYSYADVQVNARRVATELNSWGIQQGDRIMLQLSNLPEFVFACLGASFCNADITFGGLSILEPTAKQAIAKPKLIITLVAYAKEVKDLAKENDVEVMTIGEPLEGCLNFSDLIQGDKNEVPAVTTVAQQVHGENSNSDFHQNDVILFVEPLRYADLFSDVLCDLMSVGAAMLIMPEFDVVKSMELVEKFKVTIAPRVVVDMMKISPRAGTYDLSSIRGQFSPVLALATKLEDAIIRAPSPPLNIYNDSHIDEGMLPWIDSSSPEAWRKRDAYSQTSDTILDAPTSHVLEIPASVVQQLSFNSLKELMERKEWKYEDLIKLSWECEKDKWKNQELFDLVKEYFERSSQTLDFCKALEMFLERVRNCLLHTIGAVKQFEEEKKSTGGSRFVRTLEKLKNFKAEGDPFPKDFLRLSQSVCDKQELMLNKLELLMNELNKKLEDIQWRRKVSARSFIAVCALIFTGSVLVAGIDSRPAAALGAATSIPVGSVGKWIDSRWKNHEKSLKEQEEVTSLTHAKTFFASANLGSITKLIARLKIDIKALLQSADFAIKHEAVEIGMDEIKKKGEVFTKNTKNLGEEAVSCSKHTKRATDQVLQKIITSQQLTNEKSLMDDCC